MEDRFNGNTYYLVRHGEAGNNVRDILSAAPGSAYSLTARGVQQVERLAEWLGQQRAVPDFIVTSPVLRAKQTALLLSERTKLPVSVDERLTEARFGVFEGEKIQTFLEFMEMHGGRTAGDPALGIEGYMDIRARVRTFLSDLSQTFSGKRVVLVSHGDVLQELMAELMTEPVGAEQGHGGWSPRKGSVAVVAHGELIETFVPDVS